MGPHRIADITDSRLRSCLTATARGRFLVERTGTIAGAL
jgi:hypothetical protein